MAVLARQRGTRVAGLLAHLRSGEWRVLEQRAEAGQTLEAQHVAAALREALPAAELRRRLRRLGFQGEWLGGTLAAVSLTGGGVNLRCGKSGRLLTGPRIDQLLYGVFPELVPLTLRAFSNLSASPGNSAVVGNMSDSSPSDSVPEYWDLSSMPHLAEVTRVIAYFQMLSNSSPGPGAPTFTIEDPFGSCASPNESFAWSSGGARWVSEHAGDADATPGNVTYTVSAVPPWTQGGRQMQLDVTYLEGLRCPPLMGVLSIGGIATGVCCADPAADCVDPPSTGDPPGTDPPCSAGSGFSPPSDGWSPPQSLRPIRINPPCSKPPDSPPPDGPPKPPEPPDGGGGSGGGGGAGCGCDPSKNVCPL